MEQTVKALADLRAHWESEGCPSPSKIAKAANVSNATAHRYLNGITKVGEPKTVKALAAAMGRPDIAGSIPDQDPDKDSRFNKLVAELETQYHEKLQQQHDELDAKHRHEMEALMRDHRAEREDWHTLRKALHEENVSLRSSFDRAVAFRDAQLRMARIEKWICFALFVAAVALLVLK